MPVGVRGATNAVFLRMTLRQESIVTLIAAGLSDKQIATRLGMSRHTVRTHIDRMFVKYGFHNRAELLMAWLRSKDVNQSGC